MACRLSPASSGPHPVAGAGASARQFCCSIKAPFHKILLSSQRTFDIVSVPWRHRLLVGLLYVSIVNAPDNSTVGDSQRFLGSRYPPMHIDRPSLEPGTNLTNLQGVSKRFAPPQSGRKFLYIRPRGMVSLHDRISHSDMSDIWPQVLPSFPFRQPVLVSADNPAHPAPSPR
ncbi:predicted protein [Histoplasma capsulatum H143]|uniref:Uncharacterized protein n=1 Tax=Ajellomyces capsulatus (strain H143) TaxID=544712 RepID=C6HNP7_AJECH|nr:predicted protein [Histoplasma capsulatum H143]